MATTITEPVWQGAEALRPFLIPIADLEPFPGNPRRGDIAVLRESLTEFGQVLPILVVAGTKKRGKKIRIVARHHLVLAATEEEWTHVAAIPNDFDDEEQARRYLLMDNRSSDRGSYDLDALQSQLKALQETTEGLAATGYDDSYVGRLERELQRARASATPPTEFPPLDPNAIHVDYQCPSCGHGWSGHPRPGT